MPHDPRLTHPLPPLVRQSSPVPVLHSTEREGLTAVYGTSVPPAGLSGRLRRVAFRWGEADLRHWLVLLLADRIQVGEGLLEDLRRGHLPHLWKEMGLRAEWRYNRPRLLGRLLGVLALLALARAWRRRQPPRLRAPG